MIRLCSIEGCGKPVRGNGLCIGHYHRAKRYGSPTGRPAPRPKAVRPCSIEGCDLPHKGLGYCWKHLRRFRASGDPLLVIVLPNKTDEYIAQICAPGAASKADCIIWPFIRNKRGYGIVRRLKKEVLAHRLVCLKFHGPAPDGKPLVAHYCGRGIHGCINPHHLRWADTSENMADAVEHMSHVRGERSPKAKLTEHQVLEIRASSARARDIAAKFNVSANTIRAIRARKSWRHLR